MDSTGAWGILFFIFLTGCGVTRQTPVPGQSQQSLKSAPSTSPSPNQVNGGTPPALFGFASVDASNGQISGYAFNAVNPNQVIGLEFYLDGTNTSGTFLGVTNANLSRAGLATPSGFILNSPVQFVNAVPHKLYAYMIHPTSGVKILINNTAVDFIAGADASGQTFYNTNLSAAQTHAQCATCHANPFVDYFTARAALARPSPLDGGTRINNYLYLKASGGLNHGGGDQCTGTTICQNISSWWDTDFGK